MREFRTQKQVDDYIKSLGVFLNDSDLCMKKDDDNFIVINEKQPKIIDYIERNTSPFSDVEIIFPKIDFNVFEKYNERDEIITKHKQYWEEIKGSKKFLKNGWRLIHLQNPSVDESGNHISYLIYDYNEKKFIPVIDDNHFIDSKEKSNAYDVVNISILKKLERENFENQFQNAYENELEKWNKIQIYENIGDLNG